MENSVEHQIQKVILQSFSGLQRNDYSCHGTIPLCRLRGRHLFRMRYLNYQAVRPRHSLQ